MTELLSHPNVASEEDDPQISTDELQAMYDTEGPVESNQETETEAETHNEPPLTDATSRVGRIMQRVANRLENGADRADAASERYTDTKELAKKKIKGFGRSAVFHLKRAGLITVGVGIIGAKKTAEGAKTIAGTAKNQVESIQQIASDYQDARRIKAQREADALATAEAVANAQRVSQENAFASYEDNIERSAEIDEAYEMNDAYNLEQAEMQRGIDKDHSKALKKNEKFDRVKAKAERAKARKQARRERWAGRINAVKEYGRDVKEGFVETKDATIGAAKNTYESGRDKATATRRRVGAATLNFAARAESAGKGAVEGWKTPESDSVY